MRAGRVLLLALLLPALPAGAYPVDGHPYTGIRRLLHAQAIHVGDIRGRLQHPGQYLALDEVQPGWRASDGHTLPAVDAELSRQLSRLVDAGARAHYGVALLDLSDPAAPRYAVHNGDLKANVGSVGKVLVALALFQVLADLYPQDLAARERVLRDTRVIADEFSQYDHHKVPFWNPQTQVRSSRPIRVGDDASLWEYLDWAMSASSNSAASMVEKELLALRRFGTAYPPPRAAYDEYFGSATRKELGDVLHATIDDAVRRNGLDPDLLRQGSLFTRGGDQRVARIPSYATPDQLARWLFRLEAGTLVDAFSSREIKRLMYLTQRRIRYASHPALNEAAVYFKSGSLYQCSAPCAKYKGDKVNRLASIAIVESPARAPAHRYAVVVMSNVLRVNSAVAHQTLALRIQRLVQALHPVPAAPPALPESAYPTVPVDDPDAADPRGETP